LNTYYFSKKLSGGLPLAIEVFPILIFFAVFSFLGASVYQTYLEIKKCAYGITVKEFIEIMKRDKKLPEDVTFS
jgi:hypothetical protein